MIFFWFQLTAQQEFHVFPSNHETNPSLENGIGSLNNPWDLQTALNQKQGSVKPGDTIWLHEGIYNGRFVSTLKGSKENPITVSSYKNDTVVLNGNVTSNQEGVLIVKGAFVHFQNFEITWLGNFSRDENDTDFRACPGLMHLSGIDCKFYNLKIHDNPGLGIGFWKHGGASVIENCNIFNNGYMSKGGKGRGEGIYVQNKSEAIKYIRNNIIFNNYYKGIEVWSAGKRKDFEYVKNITLEGNIIFNSGSPSGRFVDNVIVASADRNGVNIAKNIILKNNVLYHNTDDGSGKLIGDAASLTLGFNVNAPIENVTVDGNVIVGGYNGLRILYANSLNFENNTIYSGNIQVAPTIKDYFQNWNFRNNLIFSRLKKPFRVTRVKDYDLSNWQSTFNLDAGTTLRSNSEFKLNSVVNLSQHYIDGNKFNVALFSSESKPVSIDFSEYSIKPGSTYRVIDVENPENILDSGQISGDSMVQVFMDSSVFQKPLHNTNAKKTLSSFGVFQIEFESSIETEMPSEEKNSFERFLEWLGF